MTYRHTTHESYDRFFVQHTEETTTPSGLIISRHVSLTSIGLQKAQNIGELLVAGEMLGIDPSGFLDNPTDSFDTPTMEEAIEPIASRAVKLGNVASIAIMIYTPDNNPELINAADKQLMNKFKAILSLEIGRKSVKEDGETIGNYL